MHLGKFLGAVVAAGAIALSALPASADGFARRGSVKDFAPPPFSWTGFYVGANIGGAWSRDSGVSSACSPFPFCNQLPGTGNVDASGFVGGFHAGYNLMIAPQWVAGIEGDFSWTDLSSSAGAGNVNGAGVLQATGGHTWSESVNWLASLRGRIGYTISPTTLLYFTGGFAWKNADYNARQAFIVVPPQSTATVDFSETSNGYVLGGGLEVALTRNWIVRGEYLYYGFDGVSASAPHTTVFAPPVTGNFRWNDSSIHSARVGISYKF